jgi:hypothetical protein
MRSSLLIICTASLLLCSTSIHGQQKTATDETAERMSGSWTINRDLSPLFKPSGRSGGRSGGPAYAIGGFVPQRGRGNGSGPGTEPTPSAAGDLTPAERAEQTAMHQIEQIAPALTITATAGSFSLADQQGEQTCAIDDKSAKVPLFGATVSLKCRWNKLALQQEFSTTRSKVTRSWSIDGSGRLVVKTRIEGISQRAVEASAVYDRNPSAIQALTRELTVR